MACRPWLQWIYRTWSRWPYNGTHAGRGVSCLSFAGTTTLIFRQCPLPFERCWLLTKAVNRCQSSRNRENQHNCCSPRVLGEEKGRASCVRRRRATFRYHIALPKDCFSIVSVLFVMLQVAGGGLLAPFSIGFCKGWKRGCMMLITLQCIREMELEETIARHIKAPDWIAGSFALLTIPMWNTAVKLHLFRLRSALSTRPSSGSKTWERRCMQIEACFYFSFLLHNAELYLSCDCGNFCEVLAWFQRPLACDQTHFTFDVKSWFFSELVVEVLIDNLRWLGNFDALLWQAFILPWVKLWNYVVALLIEEWSQSNAVSRAFNIGAAEAGAVSALMSKIQDSVVNKLSDAVKCRGMNKLVTHDLLSKGLFNTCYTSGFGPCESWREELRNREDGLLVSFLH